MRFVLRLLPVTLFLLTSKLSSAQNFSFNCTKDTSINLCNTSQCLVIKAKIPDLRGLTSSYTVNPITTSATNCFPVYSQPDDPGGTSTNLTIDDRYTGVIPIGFNFPFFGTVYTDLVASTNGYVSFDISRASQSSHYQILSNGRILTATSGTPLDLPSSLYDRALIMGPYHDLNPAVTTSPNQKIQYITVGTAPYRKWILSFFRVPLFTCNGLTENTHQIILYESTGIIEVTIFSKQICTSWNEGRAMIGLQNFNRDQGIVVPGRAASSMPWGGSNMNESYRFVPSGGESLFKRVELYNMAGSLLYTGTAVPAGDGTLDVTFPQNCSVPLGTTSYVIKSVYAKIDDPSTEIFGFDTIRVTRSTATELNATSNPTASACGPNGSITINIPNGVGVAPFLYKLDANAPVSSTNRSYTFTGVLGGPHTVSVTDAAGCSGNLAVNVPSSGVLNVTAPTSTETTCAGANNGSIAAGIPSNGVSPYQYSLNNTTWQTNNVFSNLPPGTYTVYIKDNSGCSAPPVSISVGQGPQMTTTAAGNPPSCNGATNGSITVTPPASGTAPFQYDLNGVVIQASNVFNNLAPGTYFVKVTDTQGCTTAPIPVTVPNSSGNLSATTTSTATSCSGVNNGTITITPTSGSGPYQYSINSSPFQNGTTITNLAPGTYSIIVKDNAGCVSAPISPTVVQGNALLAITTSTSTSCAGVNDGTITVTPTNGSGPYSYQLDGGSPQSSNIFSGASVGSHTIIVTDGAGCVSAPIAISVSVGPAITGTTSSAPTTCNGASDGVITVSPTTGNAPYTYAIDGGAFQSSNTFPGLTSGNHTVIIKDAAGCTSTSISVTVAAGATLTGTATSTATSCSGATDGTIVASFNGSAQDISNFQPKFSLDGGPFQASGTFTNVSAGNHTILINSINGCLSSPIPVTVAAGVALTANVTTTPTSCSGAINGTISVTPTNGTGPFQYSIDGINFQSSNTFSGLATGNYTITFKNNLGCQTSVAAVVGPGQPLTANVAANNVLCNGGNTGAITVTIATNSAPPYQYSLDGINWQASNTFSGLTTGSYTVHFRDNNNCSGQENFTITQPAVLNISPALESVLCNGQSNGKVIVAATGGTAPYQYSLNGTTYQPSSAFSVAAGTHTIYVKDANGCVRSQAVSISEPSMLAATTSTVGATCAGLGTISINAAGGSGGYQYSADGINFQSSNIFNVAPGNYTVTIRDANGCSITRNAIVGLINDLTVTPGPDETICEGTSVQLKPSTNASQFSWTNAGSLNAPNVGQPIASPLVSTQYIVTAILGVCSATDTINVNVLPAPVADAGIGGDICFGQTYQLQGSGGVSYQWSPAAYLRSTTASNPVSSPTQSIRYSLVVTDANGCRSLQPGVVQVKVTPPIVIQLTRDTAVAFGDVFQLRASSLANNYVWSPGFGLNNFNDPNPIVTVTSDITYTVTATTSAGCKGEASVTLKVYKGPDIYVPTAFTPNRDGKNDVLKPFPVGIKNYTFFRVYNRWGQVIFSTSEFNKGWDGTARGQEQPSGTYVWVVEGFTKENKKISKKGTVALIR